jgi:diphosphomevalonate decarboxylase
MTNPNPQEHQAPAAFKIRLATPTTPIHSATVSAPTNIACIKYWGKASSHFNTPINDSLSLTLDQADLRAVTTASCCKAFSEDKLWLNGKEVHMNPSTLKRFRACVDGIRTLASNKIDAVTKEVIVSKSEWKTMPVHIASYNNFPTAAGLASSAAGYAALVSSLVALYDAKEIYPGQFSAIARQGSGSACRSLYGGFVAWRAGGEREDWSDSIAEQVADEEHWDEIRAVILVVSDKEKETSSTKGMETSVATSRLLEYRAKHVVPQRMNEIEQSIHKKDFESFGKLTMMDSNQFHATCLDTYPPIFYMNDVSKSVVTMVHTYNVWEGEISAAYTFDAGPNAVLYTLEMYQVELLALVLRYYPEVGEGYVNNAELRKQAMEFVLEASLVQAVEKRCRVRDVGDVKMVYCTKGGPGPQTMSDNCSLFEFVTK